VSVYPNVAMDRVAVREKSWAGICYGFVGCVTTEGKPRHRIRAINCDWKVDWGALPLDLQTPVPALCRWIE